MMVTANWFISATEARNNIVKSIAVHGEIAAIESEILLAVQRGDYEVHVAGESPFTQVPVYTQQLFLVDAVTNSLYVPAHGFSQAQMVQVSATQQLPAPLKPFTIYYVIYVDPDHVKLAATRSQALAGQPIEINIAPGVGSVLVTDPGSGYVTAPHVRFEGGAPESPASAVSVLQTTGRLESVQVLDGGSGFTYTPQVQILSVGTGAQVGDVFMKVVQVATITFGGSSYNVGDILTLITGGGTPAATMQVTQVNAGSVTQVVLLTGGSYLSTQLPDLENSITSSSGSGAGCTVNVVMGILSVVVQSGGINYVTAPLVSVSGGSGSGAQLQAVLTSGVVSTILVTSSGSGFTATPTITMSTGSGAQAVAQLSPTQVSRIDLVNTGVGTYNDVPQVQLTTPGAGAQVNQVLMRATQVNVRSPGTAYVLGDLLYVSGGVGTQNTVVQVTQVTPSGGVQQVQIRDAGSYSVLPPLQNNQVLGGSGSNAHVDLIMGIGSITLLSGGSGYQVPPWVQIDGAAEQTAQAQSQLQLGVVTDVIIQNSGSGYTQIPQVTLTCGSGAQAQAFLVPTTVQFVDVINPGSGYTEPPEVIISGGGGTGAQAQAILLGDTIGEVIITDPGSGYTSRPNVFVSGLAQLQVALTGTSVDRIEVTDPGLTYVISPTVVIEGDAQAFSVLNPTSVASVVMTDPGSNYTQDPQVAWTIDVPETGSPVLPVTRVQRSFGVQAVVVTAPGVNYTSVPDVQFSAPLSTGAPAQATAQLSVGQGTFRVSVYLPSQDYWKVNCGQSVSNELVMRPYKDQLASVKKYFEDLGYGVVLETNPVTGLTLKWRIIW